MAASSCFRFSTSRSRLICSARVHLLRNVTSQKRFYSQILSGHTVKIGCASGFWGDTTAAAPQLIYGAKLDFLVFDYLSEITMSLLTAARRKTPTLGYAPDFVQVAMAPFIKDIKKTGLKVVSNAGGINPTGCAEALREVCKQAGVSLNIAVVEGDDLIPQLKAFTNLGISEMDSGMQFPKTVHSMNAYLGSGPIAQALDLGADIVITGRCTDSALVLGPLIHKFGWNMNQFDLLAAGSLAGHLIECGAQVTGGIFTDWKDVKGWDNIGFPIVEVGKNGEFVVSKPAHTGGLVSKGTVAEQLVYEIGDPTEYFLPDVVCDFSNVTLQEVGENMVHVQGAKGKPPSGDYKVSATYLDGFRSTAVVVVGGPRSVAKSKKTANAVIARCQHFFQKLKLDDFTDVNIEVFSTDHMYGTSGKDKEAREVVLWLAVHHSQRKALEYFARELAPAGTGMAPGLCNIAGGRPKISPVLKLFSFLYPKENFNVTITMGDKKKKYEFPQVTSKDYSKKNVSSETKNEGKDEITLGTNSYRLEDLAFTRSGDKSNHCNVGVIARHPLILPYLRKALSAERVELYFSHLFQNREGPVSDRVKRFDLPGINGLNFLLLNSLGGGGVSSLRSDPQGKAVGQMLLDIVIEDVPDIRTLIKMGLAQKTDDT